MKYNVTDSFQDLYSNINKYPNTSGRGEPIIGDVFNSIYFKFLIKYCGHTYKQIKFRILEEPSKELHLEQHFVWIRIMDIEKEGEEILSGNVVLEKN